MRADRLRVERGLVRTAGLCVALNLVCAGVAWRFYAAPSSPLAMPAFITPLAPPAGRLALQARLALTGLLGIAYEVLAVRVLSQVTEDTVYTYALLLAVYLVGTALGAAAYQRWWARQGGVLQRGHRLLHQLTLRLTLVLAWACLLSTA